MVMSATKLVVPQKDRETAAHAASAMSAARFDGEKMILLDRAGRRVEVPLTTAIAGAISAVLERLGESHELVILSEEEELTPEQAAKILGISRPLVYHRMKSGRLPSRAVGTHSRIKLKDVLALKTFEEQRAAFSSELAADTDDQELAQRGL